MFARKSAVSAPSAEARVSAASVERTTRQTLFELLKLVKIFPGHQLRRQRSHLDFDRLRGC